MTPPPSPPAAPLRAGPHRSQPDTGTSMVGRMLLLVAPAVLAAAALRPRSGSRSSSRST
ncbi:hypothetical protein [Streptomyces gobiensis]|uniref:hypothetical protein n=1 Tax=Streptomyces gobiensis TaxID=2875706 RepID=UPI001E539E64|nr:hypothetical protein [Streptomyces gobiensis]UGY94650.1 hypothetical protein test1122_24895 [Streptomyces gobiensis]